MAGEVHDLRLLPSGAALELRRRNVLLRRLPQCEGAHRRRLLRKERLELSTKAMQGGLQVLASDLTGLGPRQLRQDMALELTEVL